jgi:hypothetical protein
MSTWPPPGGAKSEGIKLVIKPVARAAFGLRSAENQCLRDQEGCEVVGERGLGLWAYADACLRPTVRPTVGLPRSESVGNMAAARLA